MGPDTYPGADLSVYPINDGGEYNGEGPPRGVWHTSESIRWTNNYYHIQYWEELDQWRQYIPFSKAARALRNEAGGTQTNRQGELCISACLVAKSANSPNMSDLTVQRMAEFMVWAQEEWGIPAYFPLQFQGGSAWGHGGDGRLDADGWINITGWVGHQDVYENTHWDPGVIPVTKIMQEVHDMTMSAEAFAFWQGTYDRLMIAKNADGDVQPASVTSLAHMLENDRALAAALGVSAADEQALKQAIIDLVQDGISLPEALTDEEIAASLVRSLS